MATIASALDTAFEPAVGNFNLQVTGRGMVNLLRRNTSGSPWALVSPYVRGAHVVTNDIAGAEYMLTANTGTPTVQADQ